MEQAIFSIPKIRISDYTYSLPEGRIAKYPLEERDASKLLVYNPTHSSSNNAAVVSLNAAVVSKDAAVVSKDTPAVSNGERIEIHDACFRDIPQLLPQNSLLVFNNTKVVPARLFFTKETGALIEVFCLDPAVPKEYVLSFAQHHTCSWYCVVGNAKKWKSGALPLYNPDHRADLEALQLTAFLEAQEDDRYLVRFSWAEDVPFATVLERCGTIPIPPYLKREAEASDVERYQTLYAKERGSVAAPTAGLHFSSRVIKAIQERGIAVRELTLHVGAGTFKPVKVPFAEDHLMHSEPFAVSRAFLTDLRDHQGPVVSVGTTSCRCLESLYYMGLRVLQHRDPSFVAQWDPYQASGIFGTPDASGISGTPEAAGISGTPEAPAGEGGELGALSYKEALQALLDYMDRTQTDVLHARTQIMIVPSYRFRAIQALVTNFHQPNSTLLLLIAAFVGDDWRRIYDHALASDYRFLSYGDSSLLFYHN